MKSNKGGILGSGIMTIIATILILAILIIFTLTATLIRSLNKQGDFVIDEKLNQSLNEISIYQRNHDDLGIIKYFRQKTLQEKTLCVLNSQEEILDEERTFLETIMMWNESITGEVISSIEGIECKPAHLELTKNKETIICIRGSPCEKKKSIKNNVLYAMDEANIRYALIELNIGNTTITTSDVPLNEKTREDSSLVMIGDHHQGI